MSVAPGPRAARAVLALALVLAAAPAHAEGLAPLRSDAEIAPWKGVGRLVVARRASCTGALVAERIVLTAAHCLYDHAARRLAAPEDVEFFAGLRDGRYADKGVGRRIVVHPEYRYSDRLDARGRYGVDIAIVELDAPIRENGARPFEVSTAFFKGDPVTVVSYAKGRNEHPSREECVTELRTERVAEFACEVDFGASGAPVFRGGPEAARIVSIVSALVTRGADRLALGAVLGHTLPLLMEELRRTSPGARSARPGAEGRAGAGVRRPPER